MDTFWSRILFLGSLCMVPVQLKPNRFYLVPKARETEVNYRLPRLNDEEKTVIIDTDAGVDDAQAILLVLSNPKVKVIAITCAVGNIDERNVERNVLRTLAVANRLDIPVYRGAQRHLIHDNSSFDPVPYFGPDGFGNVSDSDPDIPIVKLDHINTKPAYQAIVDLVKEHRKEITILALAPLTNIATAIKFFPELTEYLKGIIILGGNNEGVGNETPAAEFNFHRDPEAASIVLAETGCLITLINSEACVQTAAIRVEFKFWFYEYTASLQGKFIRKINQQKIHNLTRDAAAQGMPPVILFGDEIAAALLVDDAVCKKAAFWPTEVELRGKFTRGQCVVDKRNYLPDRKNLRNCHVINLENLEAQLKNMIGYKF